jgi:hypothetical protein
MFILTMDPNMAYEIFHGGIFGNPNPQYHASMLSPSTGGHTQPNYHSIDKPMEEHELSSITCAQFESTSIEQADFSQPMLTTSTSLSDPWPFGYDEMFTP